jgi:hypothetical protein
MQTNETWPYLLPVKEIKQNWLKKLSVRSKTIKLPEENIREKTSGIRIDSIFFFGQDPQIIRNKEKWTNGTRST